MNPYVSVGWLVGWLLVGCALDGWSICHNFLKSGNYASLLLSEHLLYNGLYFPEAEEGATLHIEEGSAHSLQQSVILDPVKQLRNQAN